MIFAYWSLDGHSGAHFPTAGLSGWVETRADFRVYGDEDVVPLLSRRCHDAAALFEEIRIPACKADVARLVLLHAFGGLYVDAHCAPGPPAALAELLTVIPTTELTLFDECAQDPRFSGTGLLNSIIGATAGSTILDGLIDTALANLRHHRDLERTGQPVRYNIYKLTGPWIIWHRLFQRDGERGVLKPQYRQLVTVRAYADTPDQPVLTYRHNGYRQPENHWSRRQRSEALFRPPSSSS